MAGGKITVVNHIGPYGIVRHSVEVQATYIVAAVDSLRAPRHRRSLSGTSLGVSVQRRRWVVLRDLTGKIIDEGDYQPTE